MGSCTSNRQDMPWSYVASKGVWIARSLLHIGPYGAGHVRGLDTVIIDLPGNLAHPQSQLDGLPVTLTAATARGAPALLPIFAKAG